MQNFEYERERERERVFVNVCVGGQKMQNFEYAT